MRKWKFVVLVVALLLSVSMAQAKDYNQQRVYMFGFAASFNDSTVYFTDVQVVDSAWVYANHSRFLVNRDDYSYQLRNYLQRQGNASPTCVTVYAFNEKEIYKKYLKLRERYNSKNMRHYFIKDLRSGEFAYRAVSPNEGTVIINAAQAEAEAKKALREEEKAAKKARKKAKKAGNTVTEP